MSELLVVTNLPSPYRLHEFTVIDASLGRRGCRLRVWFLATTERGRHWPVELGAFGPSHRGGGWPSLYPLGMPVHTDPRPWIDLWSSRPRWVLLGGAWYQPAVVAALTARPRATSALLWCENFHAESRRDGYGARFRHTAFGQADGFVAPGSRATTWSRSLGEQPIVVLPNFVDERLYRDRVAQLRAERSRMRASMGIAPDTVVFVWPARLHPHKGIEGFLHSVRDVGGSWTILIAGEGPSRPAVEAVLVASPRCDVRLLGHRSADDLARLYALGDCLLLPSILEPFGFVTVEALWAGLPLLISTNVGALPEVLDDRDNGWAVDPSHPEEVKAAFAEAVARGPDGLATMGTFSLERAEREFRSTLCADQFVDGLLRCFPPTGT